MADIQEPPASNSESAPTRLAQLLSHRVMGFMAGVVSAGLSLAFGEVIDGMNNAHPSMVVAVGELITDYTPGDVVATSIENLGSSQKWLLLTGIVVVTLLVGGYMGQLAVRGRKDIAMGGFIIFGLVGGWAVARNPFSYAAASWLVTVLVTGIGAVTLLVLTDKILLWFPTASAGPDGADPDSPPAAAAGSESNRRTFLAYIGSMTALSGVLVGIGRLVKQSPAELARANVELPLARPWTETTEPSTTGPTVMERVAGLENFNDIDQISTYLTPNLDFYRIDTALTPPSVDPVYWTLRITGMVDNPYELTFEEILDMDLVDNVITLQCVSNQVGGKLVGNAVWTGVPLTTILDRAGVQPGATQIVGRSVDDWTAGFPTGLIGDGRNALLAIGMNGEPLPVAHGFPARLIVAGLYGYVSAVKWISEIELTTWEGFDAYWVPRGWSKEGPMKTQSRIDVPRGTDRLAASEEAVIAGVAWAPTRGVQAVEVRVDGEDWQPCEMAEALGDETWVQWKRPWTPSAGRHTIEVRATDGTGAVQSEGPVPPRPDGAEGWHSVEVNVT